MRNGSSDDVKAGAVSLLWTPGLEKWRLELLFEFFCFGKCMSWCFWYAVSFAVHEKSSSEWVVHVET